MQIAAYRLRFALIQIRYRLIFCRAFIFVIRIRMAHYG